MPIFYLIVKFIFCVFCKKFYNNLKFVYNYYNNQQFFKNMKNVKKILLVSFLIALFNVFFISSVALADLPAGRSEDYQGDPYPHSLLSAPGLQGESLRVCVEMGCCSICDVMTVVSKAFKILRNDIGLPLAIIFGIIGGIMIIFSAGSPDKVKKGRTYISSALIGLLIIFGASLIVNSVTIAIADASWNFDSIMNGFLDFKTSTTSSTNCTKSCNPGFDPKLKTITGEVVDLIPELRYLITNYLPMYKGFYITSTTTGQHVPGSCHYVGRAVDFITEYRSEWDDIVDDLNSLEIPGIKAFCDYKGEIKSCCDLIGNFEEECRKNKEKYGDHIHLQIGPCDQ